MEISQTKELYWLAATVLMTAVFWVPYIIQRILERGLWNALYEPQGETDTRAPWANRMMRAHVWRNGHMPATLGTICNSA